MMPLKKGADANWELVALFWNCDVQKRKTGTNDVHLVSFCVCASSTATLSTHSLHTKIWFVKSRRTPSPAKFCVCKPCDQQPGVQVDATTRSIIVFPHGNPSLKHCPSETVSQLCGDIPADLCPLGDSCIKRHGNLLYVTVKCVKASPSWILGAV